MELNPWTVLGGVVIAYIVIAPFRSWVDGLLGGIGAAPAPGVPVIECIYDGAVMTVGPMEKKYAPTTALTGEAARVIINGRDRGQQIDSATMDVTYKDEVVVYYSENSTNSAATPEHYYAAEQSFTVPCASTMASGDADLDTALTHQVIASQKPTISIFNDDDGLLNRGGTGSTSADKDNETMTASDSANLEMKITQTAKTGWSPYGNQVITLQYNSTQQEKPDLSVISGVDSVDEFTCPTYVTNFNTKYGARAGWSTACWTIPGVHGMNTVVQRLNILLETKTTGPTGVDGTLKEHVNISIWDEDWYRHSETGEMLFGAETDVNGNVGNTGCANATIYIN